MLQPGESNTVPSRRVRAQSKEENLQSLMSNCLLFISTEMTMFALQMNMFLSRLNGAEIGFTIFDLVTLTKPFILTVSVDREMRSTYSDGVHRFSAPVME